MSGVPASPSPRFAAWRLALWVVLLLAAFGCLQYASHGLRVWQTLAVAAGIDAAGRHDLQAMLAWDMGYFAVAAPLVVCCAAAIQRQGWARPVLRVAFVLLALALAASGTLLWRSWIHWQALQASAAAAAGMADRARQVHLALGFDAVAIAVLLWLSWQLGRPAVRAQFRRRGQRA